MIQKHYDVFIDAAKETELGSLSTELSAVSDIRTQSELEDYFRRIIKYSTFIVEGMSVARTEWLNLSPPVEATELHDTILTMMDLRMQGWKARWQEASRYLRSGDLDATRLQQVNQDFATADRLWLMAKAEADRLGGRKILGVEVP